MPIRAENRKRYPKNWKDISHRIRFERARGRCECTGECGIDHAEELDPMGFGRPIHRCTAKHHEKHPITCSKVVLTVAHLDHIPENCADDNLKAMCQRCHLRYDADHHKKNSARTRKGKMAINDMFEVMK